MRGDRHFLDTQRRFWAKVTVGDRCWEWQGTRRLGYGRFRLSRGGLVSAHRFSYELVNGPVPDGLVLDHLCRNPACVRPDHLEAVTQKENARRSTVMYFSVIHGSKDRCVHGHEFSTENTYIRTTGARTCRQCQRDGYWRRKEARAS